MGHQWDTKSSDPNSATGDPTAQPHHPSTSLVSCDRAREQWKALNEFNWSFIARKTEQPGEPGFGGNSGGFTAASRKAQRWAVSVMWWFCLFVSGG